MKKFLTSVSALALLGAFPIQAQAQEAVAEVVVTGSRIARKDFASASPIVTLGEKAVEQSGTISVEAVLTQMPQVAGGFGSTTNLRPNQGRSYVDLRGLGSTRTLVLLDGRRIVPSGDNGSPDVNLIPPSLIANIEVITGGASAVYGSDAISGVVNFRTKRDFAGFQIDGQYGISDENDLAQKALTATYGVNLDDGRGNATLSMSWADREGLFGAARPYSLISPRLQPQLPTGAYGAQVATIGNAPSQAALNAVFGRYGVAAGTITPQNLATTTFGGLGFNSDGTLFAVADQSGPVNYKGLSGAASDFAIIPATVGNLPGLYFNGAPREYISIPLQRHSAYASARYDLTDQLEVYGQALFARLESSTQLGPIPIGGSANALVVPVSNPFIPADLRTLLASRPNPNGDFEIARRHVELDRTEQNRFDTFQFTAGARGQLGYRDWKWEVYGTYGNTDQVTVGSGYLSRRAFDTLLRAPDGGQSLCAGGYNPFGTALLSPACLSFVNRTIGYSARSELATVEATVQGGLFRLPGGEIRFAAGADYRRTTFDRVADSGFAPEPNPAPNGIGIPDAMVPNVITSTQGEDQAHEVFGELMVPLLADLPLVKALELGLGYRFSQYASIGGVHSYKADLSWKPIDSIRVRGGYQRAIRAPALDALYSTSQGLDSIGSTTSNDPCNGSATGANSAAGNAQIRGLCVAQNVSFPTGASTPQFVQTQRVGSLNVQEERADTYTLGLVWQPRFDSPLLSNLSVSIDYYDIRIDGAIGFLGPIDLIRGCYNIDGSNPTYSPTSPFCQGLMRGPNGSLTQITSPASNLSEFQTSGIDVQFDWRADLSDLGLGDNTGDVAVNVVANRLSIFKVKIREGQAMFDYAGTVGSALVGGPSHPEWKVVSSFTYRNGPAQVALRWQHISRQTDSDRVTAPANTDPSAPSQNYFDLEGRWTFSPAVELRLGVNNLTGNEPPILALSSGFTEPSTYDTLGRRYYAGLKLKF